MDILLNKVNMKKIILSGVLIIMVFSLNASAGYPQIIEKAKTVIMNLTKKSNETSKDLTHRSSHLQGSMDILGKGIMTTSNDVANTIQKLTSNTKHPKSIHKKTGKLATGKYAQKNLTARRYTVGQHTQKNLTAGRYTAGQHTQKKLLQAQQAKQLIAKQRFEKDKKVQQMLAQARAKNARKK